jgi:hypothetical protein
MRYRVTWDFDKGGPQTTDRWVGFYPQTFGLTNDGFVVDAADLPDANRKLREEYRLNPFYLSITPDPGGGR